jgi:hypothetical protein
MHVKIIKELITKILNETKIEKKQKLIYNLGSIFDEISISKTYYNVKNFNKLYNIVVELNYESTDHLIYVYENVEKIFDDTKKTIHISREGKAIDTRDKTDQGIKNS